jgi:hypothetical protein
MSAVILLLVSVVAASLAMSEEPDKQTSSPFAHVKNSFQFVVHAPFDRTATLFGPDMERSWAGDRWNPTFIYPQPARDVHGAIFTIRHGQKTSTWVNTVFDLTVGRMQYVYFIPDTLVTIIDVHLTPVDRSTTRVEVTYVRTALQSAANQHVRELGEKDRESGPEWQQAIETYLHADRR